MKKNTKSPSASRRQKILSFNPNDPALESANIFGLPFTSEESEIVLLPVPWEATVSYGAGTSNGPSHILEASAQVDLFHPEFPDLWKAGISMEEVPEIIAQTSVALKKDVSKIINALAKGKKINEDRNLTQRLARVNAGSENMVKEVFQMASRWLDKGKLIGLVGGDHSTPLGLFRALAQRYPSFGILQIDAHMDLRNAYEGFSYSHASIMYNALQLKQVVKLVQVGIRDFCEEENSFVGRNSKRIKVFSYSDIQNRRFNGLSWKKQCDAIIAALPSYVHISFDIDGLDPKLCPSTGTPVPGGFQFHEITYLLSALAASKKKIISFDLNEVAPGKDDWNGNVAARMLFHLCGVLARSNGRV